MQKHRKMLLYCFSFYIAVTQIAIAETGFITTTGKVVDNQGKPVEGAKITIVPGRDNVALSDSQGQFKITWRPRSLKDEVAVSYIVARYKAKNLGLAFPIDNKAGTLQLMLKPAVSLSGSVVDTEGKAISGVSLSIMFRTSDWGQVIDSQSQTDENGAFRFDALPVENLYQFRAGADGYGRKEIKFDTGDAVNNHLDLGWIELPLANMSVSGRVVDITDQPVPDIDVYCSGEGQPKCKTKSDEQGYYMLDGVCVGLVRFFAEGRVNGKHVSCQILTEAGARDVKTVVTENGYSRSYYIRIKSHEDIINSGNPYIAGRVVDEDGLAVADVPVNVRCMQKKNEKGQDVELYLHVTKFGDVTDRHGRFSIEMEEDTTCSLLFSPMNHAAMIVYDVVTGTRDLEVILSSGGTITGLLVRFNRGKKISVPNAKVELKQVSRLSCSHIGFDRDRETITDSEGRFKFEHVRTFMRTDQKRPELGPRVWELSYGDTSQTVNFIPGETAKLVELIVRPNLTEATLLTGGTLPDYSGLNLDLSQDPFKGKRLLICFFDYAQRPARHYVLKLNEQLAQLRKQGIEMITVQASKTKEGELDQWIKKMKLSAPVATVIGDMDETRFIWNVQSLPWLILTDRKHVVAAEGFGIDELDDKIRQTGDGK